MKKVVISGSGLFTPESTISNKELSESYNQYAKNYNEQNKEAVERKELPEKSLSDEDFIEKVSGIKKRHVLSKDGILNPDMMSPVFDVRADDEHSVMCEMAIHASREALEESGVDASEIGMVIAAASNMERAYPAMAIEVQHALGCAGYAFDMNVACSSATFGIKTAIDAIQNGTVKKVLMVNPEICTGHLNFRDRDCHFIFGDVCTAVVLESLDDAIKKKSASLFEVKDSKLITEYSNNIRNNFGFLNRKAENPEMLLFKQNGRKVFKEVVPLVIELIIKLIERNELSAEDIKTFWLHQANVNMNKLIAKKLLGREATESEAPIVLDEYANTSSAGSIIVFHKNKHKLQIREKAVLCSFGAGYSAGALLLEKIL